MALNSSGPISLGGTTAGQSIELENGGNGTTQISLNDTAVRSLAGVTTPNSTIIMPTNFYGKSNVVNISYTFSSNTTNASLNLSTISGYSAGKSNITVTINSGVYVYSTSVSTPALTISGGTTGDTLTIVNNGYIMGQGGKGGSSRTQIPPTGGETGGVGLSLSFGMSSCTINNTNASAYIGGGGGGGGASLAAGGTVNSGGGGGAGGGQSWNFSYDSWELGGGVGSSGGSPSGTYNQGGGGGRIFPGTGGAGYDGTTDTHAKGGGAGGGGGGNNNSKNGGTSIAGTGGSANNVGGNWVQDSGRGAGGGGGGYGAAGGQAVSGTIYSPGSGGKAVALNGKTVTWTSGNTTRVYGSVS